MAVLLVPGQGMSPSCLFNGLFSPIQATGSSSQIRLAIQAIGFGLNKVQNFTISQSSQRSLIELRSKQSMDHPPTYFTVRHHMVFFFIKHADAVHGQTVWSHLTITHDSSCTSNTTQWSSDEIFCSLFSKKQILFFFFFWSCWAGGGVQLLILKHCNPRFSTKLCRSPDYSFSSSPSSWLSGKTVCYVNFMSYGGKKKCDFSFCK